MTVDISGFGLRAQIIASNTFPVGIFFTQFADDSDPIDYPSLQIAEAAMGLNGDLVRWSKANPIKASISLIAGSQDDIIMGLLMEANRVGSGKNGARDIITMTVIYPNNTFVTLIHGVFTDGMPSNGVSSAGRLKSKTYNFAFENKIGIGA